MEEKLFNDFASVSRDEWQQKITTDLKGKPLAALNWEVSGLTGGPVYTKEDLPDPLPQVANLSERPETFGARNWINYQLIEVIKDKSANKQARQVLNAGADGLIFKLIQATDLVVLLEGIEANYCHISFIDLLENSDLPSQLLSYLESQNVALAEVQGYYQGSADSTAASVQLPHYKFISIEISEFSLSDNPVKELALTLCKTAERFDLLTEQGASASSLLAQTQYQLSLGTSYFTEIAKYRAMRGLAVRFASAYRVHLSASDVTILAKTGNWTEDIEDQHSYMLRATTEAMSAILGGTDGLCVQPFYNVFETFQKALAERSARNISIVLKEESYFNKIIDPAAGSYFVESLTHEIMEKAWRLFLSMEKAEGFKALTEEKIESLYQNLATDEA